MSARSSRGNNEVDSLLSARHWDIGKSLSEDGIILEQYAQGMHDRVFRSLSSSTNWRQQENPVAASPAATPTPTASSTSATQLTSPAPTVPQTFPRASHDEQARKIIVEWNDGEVSRFHNTWLFDHCRCDGCFHPMTKQRRKGLLDVSLRGRACSMISPDRVTIHYYYSLQVPEDIQPSSIEPSPAGLSITWSTPQSHISFFPWSVLHKTSYHPILASLTNFTSLKRSHNSATYDDPDSRGYVEHGSNGASARTTDSERILWNASIAKSPPTVTYGSLMGDEKTDEEGTERGMKKLLEKVVSVDLHLHLDLDLDIGLCRHLADE